MTKPKKTTRNPPERKTAANSGKTAGIGKGTPGPGRPRGVPNKITSDLRELIRTALDDAGGADYLATQAVENPSAFLALLGRLVPIEARVDAAIEGGLGVCVYIPQNERDERTLPVADRPAPAVANRLPAKCAPELPPIAPAIAPPPVAVEIAPAATSSSCAAEAPRRRSRDPAGDLMDEIFSGHRTRI